MLLSRLKEAASGPCPVADPAGTRHHLQADARKAAAAHTEAVAGFRALLGEHVKAADADWQHWLPRLKKDPQVRGSQDVGSSRKQRWSQSSTDATLCDSWPIWCTAGSYVPIPAAVFRRRSSNNDQLGCGQRSCNRTPAMTHRHARIAIDVFTPCLLWLAPSSVTT